MTLSFIIRKVLSYNVIGYFFLMATTIYLSRETSPEIVGVSVTLIAIVEIIALINDFSAGQQFIQNYRDDDNPTTAFVFQIIVGSIFCIVCLTVGFLFFSEYIWQLIFLMLFKLMSIIFAINSAKLYLESAFSYEAKVNICLTLFSCLASVVVLYFSSDKVWSLLALYALPKLSSLICAIYFPIKLDRDVSLKKCFRYVVQGLPLLVTNGVQRLKVHIERILFSKAFGVTELGYYTRARTFTDTLPALSFGTNRNIILTNLINTDWNFCLYNKMLKFDLFITLIVLLFVNVFIVEIVTLVLGSEWLGLIIYIGPMSLFVVTNQIVNYEKVVLLSKKKNIALYKFSIFELLATVLCFYIGGVIFLNIFLVIYILIFLLSVFALYLSIFWGSNQMVVKGVLTATAITSFLYSIKIFIL